jgi:hypothetical protein
MGKKKAWLFLSASCPPLKSIGPFEMPGWLLVISLKTRFFQHPVGSTFRHPPMEKIIF